MDSLEIEGKEYISAKRAAREHSYTMDYVGQLIRGGKLVGKKVGRAWYVEQDSLAQYVASLLKPEHATSAFVQKEAELDAHPQTPSPVIETQTEIRPLQEPEASSVEPVLVPQQQSTPVAPVIHAEIPGEVEVEEQRLYPYAMLNYVTDTSSENMPTLAPTVEHSIRINRDSGEQSSRNVYPQREAYSYPEEREEAYHTPARYEERAMRNMGKSVSYIPMKANRAPIVVGVLATAFALAIIVSSIFFTRTLKYQGGTSAVISGIEYSTSFMQSR